MKLNANEKLIKIFRRSLLVYFWRWFFVFLLITAPFFFMFALFSRGYWGVALFVFSLCLALFILLRGIFFWRKNALFLTTQRIIIAEQKGFLNKIVSNLALENINSANYQIKGFFPTIFRFGAIFIKGRDNAASLKFIAARRPTEAVEEISRVLKEKFKEITDGNFSLERILARLEGLTKEDLLRLKAALENRLNGLK